MSAIYIEQLRARIATLTGQIDKASQIVNAKPFTATVLVSGSHATTRRGFQFAMNFDNTNHDFIMFFNDYASTLIATRLKLYCELESLGAAPDPE